MKYDESKGDRDLKARTKAFAFQVIRLFSSLPKTTEAHVLGKQVLRSCGNTVTDALVDDKPVTIGLNAWSKP